MTLYATTNHPDHPGKWVVADLFDGRVVANVKDQTAAYSMVASAYDWDSLTAAGEDLNTWTSNPAIGYIGTPTGDKRQIDADAMAYRTFPHPLMLKTVTSMGHEGAVVAGRVDAASDDGKQVVANGVFDNGEHGTEAHRLVSTNMLNGVSMDPGAVEAETEILSMDDEGFAEDYLTHFTLFEMAGLTICAVPAFADAAIQSDAPAEAEPADTVVASGINETPPVEWFQDPEFSAPSPIRVSDEGHIRGHIATWGTCHIGRTGQCITAPHSKIDYAMFATGYFQCDEGCEIPIGVFTVGGGHADGGLSAEMARKHYDESGVAAADIAVGEDEFGIWISGACRPGVTALQIREMRAHPPSGDWRGYQGNLELIAVLAVNVPGFPVFRSRTASGEQVSLIAAAGPPAEPVIPVSKPSPTLEGLALEVAQLRRMVAPLASLSADALATSLGLDAL